MTDIGPALEFERRACAGILDSTAGRTSARNGSADRDPHGEPIARQQFESPLKRKLLRMP
jgi:hypothetical protein